MNFVSVGGKPYNLVQLRAELGAAGIAVGALGTDAATIFTYDAQGNPAALPDAAAPVLVAHVASDPAAVVRNAVVGQAQSAVGLALTALTPAQVRALLACWLYRAGGIDANLIVQPLGNWL